MSRKRVLSSIGKVFIASAGVKEFRDGFESVVNFLPEAYTKKYIKRGKLFVEIQDCFLCSGIGIMPFLETDLCLRAMSGIDYGVFRKGEKLVFQTVHQLSGVSSRQIAASDATIEQSVACEYGFFRLAIKAKAAR